MLKKLLQTATLAATLTTAGGALADTWTLDGDSSHLAFGSIKKDTIGEVHSFSGLTGAVGADGAVSVDIDLASVETYIDIRNERIMEHVFRSTPNAALEAKIDMGDLEDLAVGEHTTVDVEGTLSLIGTDIDVETEMFVMRVSEGRVIVTTNDMLFLSTEDLGIDAGIDKLMQLAKLPGITRTVPVTIRLVFDLDAKKADAGQAGDTLLR